jgi:hypothetical protein
MQTKCEIFGEIRLKFLKPKNLSYHIIEQMIQNMKLVYKFFLSNGSLHSSEHNLQQDKLYLTP